MKKTLLIFLCLFACCPLIQLEHVDLVAMQQRLIQIEVKGAVEQPILIECPAYSVVGDVLSQVKLTDKADLTYVSNQMILKDKDTLIIPQKRETACISINFSGLDDLSTLPGIGPAVAQKIIDYRNQTGLFQHLEDLMNVPGIKEKKWEKLKDFICL